MEISSPELSEIAMIVVSVEKHGLICKPANLVEGLLQVRGRMSSTRLRTNFVIAISCLFFLSILRYQQPLFFSFRHQKPMDTVGNS